MRSPFGIFRKHGTVLTAGLVLLCMFAFILAQYLKPEHLPYLMSMMAFGILFYLLGQPSGKAGAWAVVGVVVGFAVMLFLPNFIRGNYAATTTVGKLKEPELQKKIEERRTANQFIYEVYQAGHGPRPTGQELLSQFGHLMTNPQIRQMLEQSIQRQQDLWDAGLQSVAFASLREDPRTAREATVRTWVMAQEADEIGIRVSNAAITKYLQQAGSGPKGQLTSEKFTELREELKMSEAELYDLLRYYIKAREYQILVYPLALTPPEKMWEFYERTTVKESMYLAGVPVSAFTDQVPVPKNVETNQELTAYFNQYKDQFPPGYLDPQDGWVEPVEMMKPSPAFGVPRSTRLAYFTASFNAFKKSAPKPTDMAIAEYYQKNRVNFPNPAYQRLLEDNAAPSRSRPADRPSPKNPRPTPGRRSPTNRSICRSIRCATKSPACSWTKPTKRRSPRPAKRSMSGSPKPWEK